MKAPFKEYIKHFLIKTPLENIAKKLRYIIGFQQRRKHPELREIYLEAERIDQAMERIIHKSSNCIDIGCHLGSTLSTILTLAPEGVHLAFEPLPYKANWLRQKFPEVQVKELALSDKSGEVTFYFNIEQSGFSGLNRQLVSAKVEELIVKTARLDEILPDDYKVDFMKVDVEGGELAVLSGAELTLKRSRPVLLFECTQTGLSCFNFTPKQVFDFLTEKHSYSVFLIKNFIANKAPLNFEQFEKALQYPFQGFNFIAAPNANHIAN